MKPQAKYVKKHKPLMQRKREQELKEFTFECLGSVSIAAILAFMLYFSLPV